MGIDVLNRGRLMSADSDVKQVARELREEAG